MAAYHPSGSIFTMVLPAKIGVPPSEATEWIINLTSSFTGLAHGLSSSLSAVPFHRSAQSGEGSVRFLTRSTVSLGTPFRKALLQAVVLMAAAYIVR